MARLRVLDAAINSLPVAAYEGRFVERAVAKRRSGDLAGGFVSLPGGYGTLDETFEMATWAQLSIHAKPVVLWNINGFYDKLFAFLDSIVAAGLLRPQHRALMREAKSMEEVFLRLEEPVEAGGGKWMPGDLR